MVASSIIANLVSSFKKFVSTLMLTYLPGMSLQFYSNWEPTWGRAPTTSTSLLLEREPRGEVE